MANIHVSSDYWGNKSKETLRFETAAGSYRTVWKMTADRYLPAASETLMMNW